jgi:hypothetical protein
MAPYELRRLYRDMVERRSENMLGEAVSTYLKLISFHYLARMRNVTKISARIAHRQENLYSGAETRRRCFYANSLDFFVHCFTKKILIISLNSMKC